MLLELFNQGIGLQVCINTSNFCHGATFFCICREAFSDAEIPNDFSATLCIELQTTIHQDKPLLLD
jgi:hypothetical protein